MAKAVPSTVELVNLVTSKSVYLFNFAMCAFVSKCFHIDLLPCSDRWRRIWWQMIYMMAGLPVSSIPQCKLNRHEGAWLESFQAIGRFEPSFNEGHESANMIWKVTSLKSRINTLSFWENIITSSNEVFKDCESDIAAGIWMPGN